MSVESVLLAVLFVTTQLAVWVVWAVWRIDKILDRLEVIDRWVARRDIEARRIDEFEL